MSRSWCTTCCTSVESQRDTLASSAFLLLPHLLDHKEWEKGPKESHCQLSFPLCTFFRSYKATPFLGTSAEKGRSLLNHRNRGTVAGMLRGAQRMGLLVSSAGHSPSQPSDVQCWKQPKEDPGWHWSLVSVIQREFSASFCLSAFSLTSPRRSPDAAMLPTFLQLRWRLRGFQPFMSLSHICPLRYYLQVCWEDPYTLKTTFSPPPPLPFLWNRLPHTINLQHCAPPLHRFDKKQGLRRFPPGSCLTIRHVLCKIP